MQKIATRIFMTASVAFGVLGVLTVLLMPERGNTQTDLHKMIFECLMITVFIILPSFALSVAGKFLDGYRK